MHNVVVVGIIIMEKHENISGKTKENIRSWIENNVLQGNIFQGKTLDGCLYFVFYMVLPTIITSASLIALTNADLMNVASCYVTILISSLGCIYDAINRWEYRIGSERNRKLFIMIFLMVCVAIYCLVVIFVALIARKIMRNDFFLLAYVFSNMIAIVDLTNCFWQKLAKQDAVMRNGDERK